MPTERDGYHQTSLWRLEDDFERDDPVTDQAAASPGIKEREAPRDERNGQPEGSIVFDGTGTYTYTGYVLEDGQYVQRRFSFTADELYIYPTEPLWRVCASVDAVGRDESRQAEIKRFGKRAWHSPYRQQDAVMQSLDYIFRHDVELLWACTPYVTGFFASAAAAADRWTAAMYDAYKAFALRGQQEALLRLLAQVSIPPAVLGVDSDPQEEEEEE